MVMVHGDDKGLVLPPRVAQLQAVIIPVGITNKTTDEQRRHLEDEADRIAKELVKAGIRAKADLREGYTPGFKYNDWELKVNPTLFSEEIRNLELTPSSFHDRVFLSDSNWDPRISRNNPSCQSDETMERNPLSPSRISRLPSPPSSKRFTTTC